MAVHVNDDYQVIFPPSVQAATYHSKIDFTTWPIAEGRYRGFDYTGKDISWWKNSPVSNSFFAWQLQEDFMGGYDHGRGAGWCTWAITTWCAEPSCGNGERARWDARGTRS